MLIGSLVHAGEWGKDLGGGREHWLASYFVFLKQKSLFRVVHYSQIFSGSCVPSPFSDFPTLPLRTSEREGPRIHSCSKEPQDSAQTRKWGTCSYKLLSKCILNICSLESLFWWPQSLEAPPGGDRRPSEGSWQPCVVSGLAGGHRCLHWSQMFSQPLTCCGFLAQRLQCDSLTTPSAIL